MILMIDHYDSFTYTLVHYFEKLGAEVITKRPHEISLQDIDDLNPSHIVLSPGPGHPSSALLAHDILNGYHEKVPILGVCLGHQVIGAYFGADITFAKELRHGQTSLVHHNSDRLFTKIATPLTAMRYHSLCIAPESLPDMLQVTAWLGTIDQPDLIMAIQHKTLPIFGVQFHPESILTEHGYALLNNFIA